MGRDGPTTRTGVATHNAVLFIGRFYLSRLALDDDERVFLLVIRVRREDDQICPWFLASYPDDELNLDAWLGILVALQDNGVTAERMMGALLRGVSTRQYEEVLPEMAETVGVSRSSISRQAIEGSAEQLRQLREPPALGGAVTRFPNRF